MTRSTLLRSPTPVCDAFGGPFFSYFYRGRREPDDRRAVLSLRGSQSWARVCRGAVTRTDPARSFLSIVSGCLASRICNGRVPWCGIRSGWTSAETMSFTPFVAARTGKEFPVCKTGTPRRRAAQFPSHAPLAALARGPRDGAIDLRVRRSLQPRTLCFRSPAYHRNNVGNLAMLHVMRLRRAMAPQLCLTFGWTTSSCASLAVPTRSSSPNWRPDGLEHALAAAEIPDFLEPLDLEPSANSYAWARRQHKPRD